MARIAVITTSYPAEPGDPSGHFVETEVEGLAALGHAVELFAPIAPRDCGRGVQVVSLAGSSAFGWPGALAKLKERPRRLASVAAFIAHAMDAVRRRGPFDRTVAHFLIPSGWPIALASEGPLEVVGHGSDVRLLERLPGRRRIVRAWLDRGARLRLASADLLDRLARATTPELRTIAVVEPPPLNLSESPTRRSARGALGIEESARLTVIVGRLVANKRIDRAVTYARSLERSKNIAVIGDGPLLGELRARHPDVAFLGRLPRNQALAWIAAADRLVSASRDEGAPTAIREALALGVPVFSAPAGDLRRWARTQPLLCIVDELAL